MSAITRGMTGKNGHDLVRICLLFSARASPKKWTRKKTKRPHRSQDLKITHLLLDSVVSHES